MTQGINIRLSATGGADVSATIRTITRDAAAMAARFAAFAGFVGGGAAFGTLIKSGVAFNAELEQAVLGIAAVQKQMNPARFKTFDAALESAASAVELLKEKAKTSPASFSELVQAFQSVSGAATSAGIPLQKQIDLVVLMSQALAGLGIRSDQITQESRALLTGNINEDAMAARILGITKQDIEKAKEAGTLFEFLTSRLEAFGEAGRRGTNTFRTLASNIKDAMEQAAGEATKPLFDVFKRGMEEINAIDWLAIGKRAGAFTQVVIESWREGRFAEIVGLTIEAGFEMGTAAVKRSWIELGEFLGSPRMWATVAHNLVATINGALKRVASGFIDTLEMFATTALKIMHMIARGIVAGFNWVATKVEGIVNEQIAAINVLFSQNFAPISIGRIAVDDSALASGTEALTKVADKARGTVGSFFNEATEWTKFLLGFQSDLTDSTGETVSAWQKLNALIAAVLAKNAANAAKPLGGGDAAKPAPVARTLDPLMVEREMKAGILSIEEQRKRLDGDFAVTEQERYKRKKAMLGVEIDMTRELVDYLREQAALANDPAARQGLLNRADSFDRDIGSRITDLSSMGPDPESFGQQWTAVLTRLRTEWGTWAQQTAQAFATVFNSAVSSISDGITGLIMGTKTWGQALVAISNTILTTVVQSIVEMGVRWAMTHVFMKGVTTAWEAFKSVMRAKDVVQSNATELAKTPSLSMNAILASIGSYGVAAAIGAAAVLAIMAGTGAFADGGWVTGPGGGRDDKVMARLSNGEFVMNAQASSRYGSVLEAMNSGRDVASVSRAGGPPSGGGGTKVNLATFDNRRDADNWAQSQDAETWFVDMSKRTAHRWQKS